MRGKLIVVEGSDGSGKTSLIERLQGWLLVNGNEVEVFREPGSTPIGEAVRTLIKDPNSTISVTTQTELLWLSRARLLEEIVQPKLSAGVNIILDRYWFSTLVYQHEFYKDKPIYDTIRNIIEQYYQADYLIYLKVSPEVAYERCRAGNGRGNVADMNDDKPLDVFVKWSQMYNELFDAYCKCKPNYKQALSIDGDQVFSEVANDACHFLVELSE